MSAKAKCAGTTKAGNPCSRPAMDGHTTCIAHATEEVRASKGFGGSRAGAQGGRPKTPRVVDVLREKIEQEADEWLDVLREAREATMGVSVGFGKDAYLETVPDYRTRLAAFKEAMDRGYGRPTQAVEMTGAEGGPVEMVEVKRDPAAVATVLAVAGVRPPTAA